MAIKFLRRERELIKNDYVPNWKRYSALKKYLPTRGFFVEAGANDGVIQSNTIGLERWGGWNGLLVEPMPDVAAKCRAARPKSIVENFALVSADFKDPTITLWHANLMTVVKNHRDDEQEHLQKARRFIPTDPTEVTVPVTTLSALLTKHSVKKIDFISLDMEGYEAEALKGLDFAQHGPDWFLIEKGDRPEIKALVDANYTAVTVIGQDTLFRRKTT